MIGITEVAKKAGVSIATVSNVINNKKPVSDELTKKVEDAIKELGYQVNGMASSMKKRKTYSIGVILPKISQIYFPEVLQGIDDAAKEFGYKILYFNSGYDFEAEKNYVTLLKAGWVDGIIIDSCCPADSEAEYSKSLNCDTKKIPIVSLEKNMQGNLSSVIIDNKYYAYLATEYLIGLGHTQIAHIGGPQNMSMCLDNLEGYKEALIKNAIEVNSNYIDFGNYTPMSGYNVMKEFLNRQNSITAVFAANDQMAIGAIKAIKEAGLNIPKDIAVIGFDNIFVGTLISPSLTTINVPRYKIGHEAVKLIVNSIKSEKFTKNSVNLECNLVKRKSTEISGIDGWDLCGW